SLEVHRRVPSALALDFVGDLLTFVEAGQTCPLDGAYVDEHILAAAVGLNEAESLGGVEPLHCAFSHGLHPSAGARVRALMISRKQAPRRAGQRLSRTDTGGESSDVPILSPP